MDDTWLDPMRDRVLQELMPESHARGRLLPYREQVLVTQLAVDRILDLQDQLMYAEHPDDI